MRLGALIGHGLDELTLTTNAMRLAEQAPMLAAAGVRRINVSLDTLDGDAFRHITRVGDLSVALRGIDAARAAGLAVKINMVALAGLRSEEHTSELQSLMRISYAVFCLTKKKQHTT